MNLIDGRRYYRGAALFYVEALTSNDMFVHTTM